MKLDSIDKLMAGLFTVLAVGTIGLVGLGLYAAFRAAPALTTALTVAFWVASTKVYPRIARFISEEL